MFSGDKLAVRVTVNSLLHQHCEHTPRISIYTQGMWEGRNLLLLKPDPQRNKYQVCSSRDVQCVNA